MHKILGKTNTSYPLIGTHTCAYQGATNVSFSKNFVYIRKQTNYLSAFDQFVGLALKGFKHSRKFLIGNNFDPMISISSFN